MRENISEFIDRQNRKVARFGRAAEAAAHEAYRKSIRLGQDLKLSSPGDVIRHGAGAGAVMYVPDDERGER